MAKNSKQSCGLHPLTNDYSQIAASPTCLDSWEIVEKLNAQWKEKFLGASGVSGGLYSQPIIK